MTAESVTYFDSFGVKYISKEIRKLIGSKYIIINIYKNEANDPITNGYICIEFIDFTLEGKVNLSIQINFFLTNIKGRTK